MVRLASNSRASTGTGRSLTPSPWLHAAIALDDWMRVRDYEGHDPFDLLSSPLVRILSLRSRWLAVAWTQLGKRSPLDLRGVLRVNPARNAKGIGLVLAAHVRLAGVTGDARWRDSAATLVRWLADNAISSHGGIGWGYPFPWANRDFEVAAGVPSSVATVFVGQALLDAHDAFADEETLDLAQSAARFLTRGLRHIEGKAGAFCFSYTPQDQRVVHNANLLTASFLARVGRLTQDSALQDMALRACRFSVVAQRADGSWPYGATSRNSWVDSFHTSYNLVALHDVRGALATHELDDAIVRGAGYWQRTFLRGPAVPLYAGSEYPIDMHAVAHAILTLCVLRAELADPLAHAERLAEWSLREMRDASGFFYYQKHPASINRIAYMRWTQAWMLRALSELAQVMVNEPGRQTT